MVNEALTAEFLRETYPPSEEEGLPEDTVKLELTEHEVVLVRNALSYMLESYTRHEHMLREINSILSRLPKGEEEVKAAA